MMNVPLSVIRGKSPMNTVWLLISPVLLYMNSAVTYRGAEEVISRSLHSSIEYLGASNRCSRNDSDMDPPKSSIGEISSKMSSRPEVVATESSPISMASATRSCHVSETISQTKLSVCRPYRWGPSWGSRIFAKELFWGGLAVLVLSLAASNWFLPSASPSDTSSAHSSSLRRPSGVSDFDSRRRRGSLEWNGRAHCYMK